MLWIFLRILKRHNKATNHRWELSTLRGAQNVGSLLRYKTINPDDKGSILNNEPMSATKHDYVIIPKKKWTPDEVKEIETLFADNIGGNGHNGEA